MIDALTELAPKPRQVHINGSAAVGALPDLTQQLPAGNDPALVGYQVRQKVELQRCQVQQSSVHLGDMPSWVDQQPSHAVHLGCRCRSARVRPAQYRPDTGLELGRVERLDDVVVRPGVQKPYDKTLVVTSRGHHDRDVADRTNHGEKPLTRKVGQPEVEHHRIGRVGDKLLKTAHRVGCRVHRVPPAAQRPDEGAADRWIILDQQQVRHNRTLGRWHPCVVTLHAAPPGRRAGLLVVVWAIAVPVAAALGVLALRTAGDDATPAVLSAADAAALSTASPAAAPKPPPTPSPTSVPTDGPVVVQRRVPGAVLGLRCEQAVPELVWSVPDSGWRVEDLESKDGELQVGLEADDVEVRVTVTCSGGRPDVVEATRIED